jgi:hypothetical protein
MNLAEYYDMLLKFDWYYSFSDDHSVYTEGLKQQNELEAIARSGERFNALYESFKTAMFSGEPWGTEKVELPKLNEPS